MLHIAKRKDGAKLTLAIGGRLDTGTAEQLDAEVRALPGDVNELTFDMADLAYLSSSGIRVLLTAAKTMDDRGGGCTMANVPETIMEVFETCGLLKVFAIA
jgi:anti-sigma B factor antagonist